MGTKIAITFSILFRLEADFYHRLYKNARRVFLDHFFKGPGIILRRLWLKRVRKKTPVAAGQVCNFVQPQKLVSNTF